MRIVIGETPRVGATSGGQGSSGSDAVQIEARLLDVRSPRKRRGYSPDGQERREQHESGDPVGGRVITLLIPDGQKLPRGVENGSHRIFLRFVPRYPTR